MAIVETAPFGGLLHYAVQLGDALADRGHRVEVIVPRENELRQWRGSAVMRPVLVPPVLDSVPVSGMAQRFRRLPIALRLARAWARIFWEKIRGRHDVLVLNMDIDLWPVAAAALALTALPGRTRLALVCHSVRPINRWGGDEMFSRSRPLLALLARLYPRLDLVLVHGERSRAEFDVWPQSRVCIMTHGNEQLLGAEPAPASAEERILFFGDWRKVKGLPILMEAFDRLSARCPSARLTIAGHPAPEDGDTDAVLSWAAAHGDRVEVRPEYVPREEVPGLFARCRVVATPYLVAYQSGVVHLAMTMGRAVVTSDAGDLADAVADGRTGLVVPAGDPDALADALERVLLDPQLAASMGDAARERALHDRSWSTSAEQLEHHLTGIVGG